MKRTNDNRNKGRGPLFRPLAIFFAVLFGAVAVYAVVRVLMLAAADDFNFGQETLSRLLFELIPPVLAVLIAVIGAAILLRVGVSRPVRKLTRAMGKFTENVAAGAKTEEVPARGGLMALSGEISRQSEKTLQLLEDARKLVAAETEERVRLSIARSVLRSAVPERLAFDALNYGVAGRSELSRSVGADFFDAFAIDPARIFLAVGDVWGEGLPAAMLASRIKSELRASVFAGKSLSEALIALNRSIYGNAEDLFATAFIAVFYPETGELHFANAGHPAPVFVGGFAGFLRMRAGLPLGAYEDFTPEEFIFPLHAGQGLVLYSDGVTSARNPKQGAFGFNRLLDAAKELFVSPLGAEYVAEELVTTVKNFSGTDADLAVLALYYPNGLQRRFRADYADTVTMRDLLLEWLGGDPRRKKILLICEEIFGNIVSQSGANYIHLNCSREEGTLILRFTDDGKPFDPLSDKPSYALGEGGTGMSLVRSIGGDVYYRTQGNLNVLTMRLPVIQGF